MGLLDRAKKMIQGRSTPVATRTQYYRVPCGEGHILHGQRTEGYQALRCPSCGDGIFVLPRSPLPEPVAPASAAAKARSPRPMAGVEELVLADPPSQAEIAQARAGLSEREAPEADANIEWVDEATEVAPAGPAYSPDVSLAPAPGDAPAPARPASRPSGTKPPAPRRPEPERVPAGQIRVEETPTLLEWATERRNPLIFVAVVVVVLATVAFRVRQKRLADLPRVAEIGRVEGLTKLDLGEFLVAKKLLADASDAVDALGGQVEGAEEIRQGALEAAIFADLIDESLDEIVEKAAKYSPQDGWPSHFDAIYKRRSILVEAQVVAVPDPAKPESTFDIDYRLYFGRGVTAAGKGRLDFHGFLLFEQARPKVGDRVIFGARLASIRLDTNLGEFLVGLVPDSGVFITHARALSVIDFTPAEAAEEQP